VTQLNLGDAMDKMKSRGPKRDRRDDEKAWDRRAEVNLPLSRPAPIAPGRISIKWLIDKDLKKLWGTWTVPNYVPPKIRLGFF